MRFDHDDEEDQDEVHELCHLGQYGAAVYLARRLLEKTPDDGRLWQICGLACWRSNNFAEAQEALEEASALIPLQASAQFALADCYVRAEQVELACVIYEHLGQSASDTAMLSAVARRLGTLGQHQMALGVCRRITSLAPWHHQAFFGIAFYMGRLGYGPARLVGPLAMAMDLAPHVPQYRINLALAWSAAGSPDHAYELAKAIDLEAITCACWLRRLRELFDAVGDHARSLTCQVRLSCVLQ